MQDLEGVYRQHHAFVWRTVQRLGVTDDSVDDAVHDTFLVVARRMGDFNRGTNFKTWLFAIAMRVAQGYRRDRGRRRSRFTSIEGQPTFEPKAPDVAARRESAELLHRLLDELDDDQRAAFIMIEMEGMTAPEVASTIGTKLATVYSRLRLAKEKLTRLAAALDDTSVSEKGKP